MADQRQGVALDGALIYISRITLLYQGHTTRIADVLDKAARKPPATTAKSGQKSGQTTQAAAPAKQEALAREAAYFRTNHLRMNYLEMREEEWPVGNSVIESGAKQFEAGFIDPGMRRLRRGAENLISLRAAVLATISMLPGLLPTTCPQRDM